MANKKTKASPKAKAKGIDNKKKKLILALVALIAFGGIGVYMLRSSSANTTYYTSFLTNSHRTSCNGTPTLSVGSRGGCVVAVQQGLNNWTLSQNQGNSKNSSPAGAVIAVDGVYGNSTRDKVIAYQKAKKQNGKNLAADGIMGPATWAAFMNDCTVFGLCGGGK